MPASRKRCRSVEALWVSCSDRDRAVLPHVATESCDDCVWVSAVDVDGDAVAETWAVASCEWDDGFWASFADHGKGWRGNDATISEHRDIGNVKACSADAWNPAGDLERKFADGAVPD